MNTAESLFDPTSGVFAANIRSTASLDDTELRELIKANGWHKRFPAIKDENGVVIVGHRRLKLAAELGIEPVIDRVTFGSGAKADEERATVAILSNLGQAPLTQDDRRRIAEQLYNANWTMPAIAAKLGVSTDTISRDLRGFQTSENLSRPKGGRPKTPLRKRKYPEPLQDTPTLVLDQEKSVQEATAVGVSSQVVIKSVAHEQGRREAKAEPEIKGEDPSMSAREKLEVRIRALEAELAQARAKLSEASKRVADVENAVQRRGVIIMTKRLHQAIRKCLHSDRMNAVTPKELDTIFRQYDAIPVVFIDEERMAHIEAFGRQMQEAIARREADLRRKAEERREKQRARRAARKAGESGASDPSKPTDAARS